MAVFEVNDDNSLVITNSGEAKLVIRAGGEQGLIEFNGIDSISYEDSAHYKQETGTNLGRVSQRDKCFKPARLYVGGIDMSKVKFSVHPPIESVQTKTSVPLFRKNDHSEQHYAAGFYALVSQTQSTVKCNPMMQTVLGAQRYEGPFTTELQAKRALSRIRKA